MLGNRVWPATAGYDLAAPFYDGWYWSPFWRANERPIIERFLTSRADGPLVDIGCGTGAYLDLLSATDRTVGVDPSEKMLSLAQKNGPRHAQLVRGVARKLPFFDNAFGAALAARSLSHEIDLPMALSEIARILRPGGILIVSDVHAFHEYENTRIPINSTEDVYIATMKRTPHDYRTTIGHDPQWRIEQSIEVKCSDLHWVPDDERFSSIDFESRRPIFFVMAFRRN